MSDESNDDSQFGSIASIRDRLGKTEAAIADFQARVEPLQDFTNRVNQILQRLDAIEQIPVIVEGLKVK